MQLALTLAGAYLYQQNLPEVHQCWDKSNNMNHFVVQLALTLAGAYLYQQNLPEIHQS